MKKWIALLLSLCLALSLFACNSGTSSGTASETASDTTSATTSDAASDTPSDTAGTDEAKHVYNVVSLVNGNLGDKSFFDSAESGLKELQDAGRITYKTIEMGAEDENQPKWRETLYEVAESGEYDLIICGTYQMPDFLKEVATAYPDQKFLIYDDDTYVGENANVVNLTYRQNDMGYLIGVLAAAMTSETSVANINADKVVGFVGGEDSPVINDFLYGFLEGVKATDPEVKVDTRYVTNYYDTAAAKELAKSMIKNNHCDIIWGVAGVAGNGAAEAAQETGEAWFIGVDSDQELTLQEQLAAITLTSGLKNVGQSIVWIFDQWDAGNTYWGQEVNLGMKEGGVGIVTDKNFANVVPQAVQDMVLAAQAGIIDGSIVVPSALGDTTNGAQTLREAMKP